MKKRRHKPKITSVKAAVAKPKLYQPVWRCIYCGTDEGPFSKEHIIAHGLNGESVLPRSSCEVCRKITSDFETAFLRGAGWQYRTAMGFASRRPDKIPATFPLGVIKDGVEKTIDVPVGDHPIIMVLPRFGLPAYFRKNVLGQDVDYQKGISVNEVHVTWLRDREEVLKNLGVDSFSVEHKIDGPAFARMIAKIAYSFAVAELGLDRIDESFVLPGILGHGDDLGMWVGSSDETIGPDAAQHQTQVMTYAKPDGSEGLIIVLLKLFANIDGPGYMVIVGRPKPRSATQT